MVSKFESTNKMTKKEKNANGNKARRRTATYWSEKSRQRRKQSKVSYDTFRREEQPDAKDLWLEDLHFANFLGLSTCAWGEGNYTMAYNDGKYYDNFNIDNPVNINFCDLYLREYKCDDDEPEIQEPTVALCTASSSDDQRDDDWVTIGSEDEAGWTHQSELDYNQETRTLSSNDWTFQCKKIQEPNTTSMEDMIAYMKQQVKLAEHIAHGELYNCKR